MQSHHQRKVARWLWHIDEFSERRFPTLHPKYLDLRFSVSIFKICLVFDFAHLRNKIDIAWHRNLLKFFENSKNSTELHLGSFHPYYIHAICFKYQSIRPWWPLQPPVATRRAVKAIQHIVDDRSVR